MSITVHIQFTPNYVGPQSIWMDTVDNAGGNSGWQPMNPQPPLAAFWTVGPYTYQAPAVALSPTATNDWSGNLTVTATDVNGYNAIPQVQVLINSALSGTNGCYINYDPYPKIVYLINGSSYVGGTIGNQGVVSVAGGQCAVDTGKSSATTSGNTVYVNLWVILPSVAPTATPPGQENIWVGAVDRAGISSGWQSLGTWKSSWKGMNYSARGHSYFRS